MRAVQIKLTKNKTITEVIVAPRGRLAYAKHELEVRMISLNHMKNKQYIEPSPEILSQNKLADNLTNNKYNETDSYLEMDLLRFITSGSVDDGKSTLIGRLMYDTKSIFQDQLDAMEKSSKKRGEEHVNLALLTDGLKAEREQGITIDVAYRYFATPKRKFIMADTPGHIQYTRNMVTGASTANLAVVLIDARNGVVEQTRRHTYIASLLGIKHIIVAINKMDLVDFSEEVHEKIKKEYSKFVAPLGVPDIHFIPISALNGDNVVDVSAHMLWYKGKTVLQTLETVQIISDHNFADARFPVQRVIRPQSVEHPDFRGFAGRVEGGVFRPGDSVTILPSGLVTQIDKIYNYKTELKEAFSPMSVTVTLTTDVDISRGDMLVNTPLENTVTENALALKQPAESLPNVGQELELIISWFNDKKLNLAGKYILKHTTREVKAMIKNIEYKVDVNTLEKVTNDASGNGALGTFGTLEIHKNDIVKITVKTAQPIFFDSYKKNRTTGSVILIDEFTNETVAAGMIL
jgi:sulfate adenylyltransferase subunit 1